MPYGFDDQVEAKLPSLHCVKTRGIRPGFVVPVHLVLIGNLMLVTMLGDHLGVVVVVDCDNIVLES